MQYAKGLVAFFISKHSKSAMSSRRKKKKKAAFKLSNYSYRNINTMFKFNELHLTLKHLKSLSVNKNISL